MDISNAKINALVQKICASKARILSSFPFYGVLIMETKFFLDPKEKSFSTNGKDIFFNPNYLDSLNNEELDISILHEIFHIVLKHPYRYYKTMDNDLFHLAADIVVNSNIMKSNDRKDPLYVKGKLLPYLAPNKKEGFQYTAEEVYQMLLLKYPQRAKALKEAEESDKQESDSGSDDKKQEGDTFEEMFGPELIHQAFNYVPDKNGVIYFRESCYRNYMDHFDWNLEDEYQTPTYSINPLLLTSDKLINLVPKRHVKARRVDNVDYLPYPNYLVSLKPSFYDIESVVCQKLMEFDYYDTITDQELIDKLCETKFSIKQLEKVEKEYRKFVHKQYLAVSNLHKQFFTKFASDRNISGEPQKIIINCRNAIAQAAKYDLKFPKNATGKDDVLYFLCESKLGICYHFATALVLLYRALGIPARFTTGYLVNGKKGLENIAFRESGHAWVEVYLDGTGWVRIDPTPIPMSNTVMMMGGTGSSGKDGKSNNNNNDFDSNDRWEEARKEREKEMTQEEIDARILKAYEIQENHGNGCGNIPGFIESIVEELRKPKVDWRTVLNDFIQENVNDYSFMIPDNRFQDSDFILPSFSDADFEVKNVLFMVDCSGSMSTKDITDCYSEIKGAIDQFGGKLKGFLGFFDTMVYRLHEIDDTTDITKLKPVGRGGTDFSSVFQYVNKKMEDNPPSVIIILSDGDAPTPDQRLANNIPTLWIINNKTHTPKWGKVVRLTDK